MYGLYMHIIRTINYSRVFVASLFFSTHAVTATMGRAVECVSSTYIHFNHNSHQMGPIYKIF